MSTLPCLRSSASVIEKGAASRRQFDAAHAADEKRGADFMLEVPHLTAEGGLRRMQAAFRRKLHTPRLRDGDEIAKVPQFHASALYLVGISVNLQSLFRGRPSGCILAGERGRCGWDADGR